MPSQVNLAWILATCSDPQLRDGKEAVRRAELVFRAFAAPQPQVCDVLAAAYAADGRFDEAVETLTPPIEKLMALYADARAAGAPEGQLNGLVEQLKSLHGHQQQFQRREPLIQKQGVGTGVLNLSKE